MAAAATQTPTYRQFTTSVVYGGGFGAAFGEGHILRFPPGEPVPADFLPHTVPITFEQAATSGRKVEDFDGERFAARTRSRVEPPEPELIAEADLITRLKLRDAAHLAAIQVEGYLRSTHVRGDGTKLVPATAIQFYETWLASITGTGTAPKASGWLR